ncbi:MAG: DEAD/DEAH box helicase, partial [Candidatus Eremiobacteraeota bacterium]|nr:DEAD/DEAH box helicase [Candidatus Eremiobacteraeota bacterium]
MTDHLHPLVAGWFAERYGEPTEPQVHGWPLVRAGRDVLISAPTGSGKTLAAFTIALDGLIRRAAEGTLGDRPVVVYVSPLKALTNDVRKNLEVPLAELRERARTSGFELAPIRTATRTGDTPAAERAKMLRTPPHVLVTTPESLNILLTAERSRARRGARMAAITSGGAIPETANYNVVAEPDGTVVGNVDEDFAIESMSGDIFLLGTTSWLIRRVEAGVVRVENANGAPPSIPFWNGEGLGRTVELSAEVAALRRAIDERTDDAAIAWLLAECALDRAGAEQAVAYVRAGKNALGTLPTDTTLVAERFFDE